MDLGSIKEIKLTHHEEREAFALARAGSQGAFDALVAGYVRNLRGTASAMLRADGGGRSRVRLTRKEAEQAAQVALWDAELAVDLAVEGRRVVRILAQHLGLESLDTPVSGAGGEDGDADLTLHELVAAMEDTCSYSTVEDRLPVWLALSTLAEPATEVIRLAYGLGGDT